MRTSLLLAALTLCAAPALADARDTTPATTNNAGSTTTRAGELKTGSSESKPAGSATGSNTMGSPGSATAMNHDASGAAPMGKEMFTPEMVLNKIHAINLEEIEGGKVAKSNGDKKVHAYADRMIKDHTKADKDLMTLAQKKNVTIQDPATATNMPQAEKDKMAQHKAMMDQMKAQKGADFDEGYITMMSKGHAEALEFLQQAESNLEDKDVKSFVGKITPVVKDHKKMADALTKTSKVQGRR